MEWRLLAVLGVLWSYWMLAILPGALASPSTSRQETSSPLSTAASPSSITLVTPYQHSVNTSVRASIPELLKVRKSSSECNCEVSVGSKETKEVVSTTKDMDVSYLIPEEDFHGIHVELVVTHGYFRIFVSKEDLCVRNNSVVYELSFRALPDYNGLDHWAIRISGTICTKTIRSPYLYNFNWFHRLRVTARGSSCWRTSSDFECSSADEDDTDESPQEDDTDESPQEDDTDESPQTDGVRPVTDPMSVLMIVLPILATVFLVTVVAATLFIRRKGKSHSRPAAGPCDGAGHPDDQMYETVSIAEVRERRGSVYDSKNSLYMAFVDTGTALAGSEPAAGSCDRAGHPEEPIYEEPGLAEVQQRAGYRHDGPSLAEVQQRGDYHHDSQENIYANVSHITSTPGARSSTHDSVNSLYMPFTGTGGC